MSDARSPLPAAMPHAVVSTTLAAKPTIRAAAQ
jgi:hypothetical protein